MEKKKFGAVGYEPGRQCPFTPSRNSNWVPRFNQLLEVANSEDGTSRNKLTEMLLEQALDAQIHQKVVTIPCDELTKEEMEVLKSSSFQQLIIQTVKNMTQNLNAFAVANSLQNQEVAATVSERKVDAVEPLVRSELQSTEPTKQTVEHTSDTVKVESKPIDSPPASPIEEEEDVHASIMEKMKKRRLQF